MVRRFVQYIAKSMNPGVCQRHLRNRRGFKIVTSGRTTMTHCRSKRRRSFESRGGVLLVQLTSR